MSSGEWLSSPRTPGVVSLRLAKYVENSQMDTRISWPQGKVGSYSALKNTLVRKHCEFWPYPTPYMVSHPFPLKRQKKLANKLAESGVPPSHGLGKEFPECLRIVLAEDMGAPPALPAAPCPWIRQATQSITWPGGRRSAKYGLRFGVIYNPPKCQVGSVCWNLLDCIKACSVVMVAPCLQGGPRLVAHRLRWGPRVGSTPTRHLHEKYQVCCKV